MLRILILSQSFGDYLGDIKSNILPTLAAFATQFLSTLIILIIVKKFLVKPALEYMEKRKQICILLSGKADLIRYDLNGNKDIVDRFNKNDVFGEAFYPVNNNNELFVLATETSEVLLFLYDDTHTYWCYNYIIIGGFV